MPIRAENKARYPQNWPEISAAIRARAGNVCEECGVANYAIGARRRSDGAFLPAMPTGDNGLHLTWPKPGEVWWCGSDDTGKMRTTIIRIVLTVAHLDHQPENCAPENLRAWCQRCHNRYDARTRAAGIKARRRAVQALSDLPGLAP